MKKLLVVIFAVLSVIVSAQSNWKIIEIKGSKIPLSSDKELLVSSSFSEFLLPYQEGIVASMSRVLAYTPANLRAYQPESPLSNLSADIYRKAASDFLGENIDLAISNLGGLRSQIPAGNITLGKVFEVMPFKNELEILWVRGKELIQLMNNIASDGGQGVSGVSFKIVDGRAENILINSLPINSDKIYIVATNNYLAEGNDNMAPLKKRKKIVHTEMLVRDAFIDYLEAETAAGREIVAKVEGRITNK